VIARRLLEPCWPRGPWGTTFAAAAVDAHCFCPVHLRLRQRMLTQFVTALWCRHPSFLSNSLLMICINELQLHGQLRQQP
jgi:hypothetical protein